MSSRRRVLAQWRGVDLEPLESARRDTAKPAALLIPEILRSLDLDRRRSDAEIVKVWNGLLDPAVTAHAQPVNLAKGTLFVSVDTSAWLDEIVRYRRREILDRLQHAFGREVVKRISFRVG
jgi:predicted nucleic acid-binding Zn ribbon protein